MVVLRIKQIVMHEHQSVSKAMVRKDAAIPGAEQCLGGPCCAKQ